MIHMQQMAQFMNDYIVNDFHRRHGEPVVEGQLFIRAAAPPFGSGFNDFNGFGLHLQHRLITGDPLGGNLFQAGKIKLFQLKLQLLRILLTGIN
ncbi:hypothetical protein D3C87_1832630 [compost metagenome]